MIQTRREFMKLGLAYALGLDEYIETLEKLREKEEKAIERIKESVYVHECHVRWKDIGEKEFKGMGIVIGDKYLTCSHIASGKDLCFEGMEHAPREEKVVLNGVELEKIINHSEKDIAVFKLPKATRFTEYPYTLGNSDKIKIGQYIIAIMNPSLYGKVAKQGIIIRKTAPHTPDDECKENLNNQDYFGTDLWFIGGDSGGVVLDKLNYDLLGIIAFTCAGIGYSHKINKFKSYL